MTKFYSKKHRLYSTLLMCTLVTEYSLITVLTTSHITPSLVTLIIDVKKFTAQKLKGHAHTQFF